MTKIRSKLKNKDKKLMESSFIEFANVTCKMADNPYMCRPVIGRYFSKARFFRNLIGNIQNSSWNYIPVKLELFYEK